MAPASSGKGHLELGECSIRWNLLRMGCDGACAHIQPHKDLKYALDHLMTFIIRISHQGKLFLDITSFAFKWRTLSSIIKCSFQERGGQVCALWY